MNFKLTLLIFLNIFLAFQLQAQIKTVYLSSFGAIANDNKSDQAAFNKAADYINSQKGNTRLLITKGKYIVGVQPKYTSIEDIPTGAASLNDVMNIKNCSNVIVEGIGKVIIKFQDNIPIGTLPNRKNNADSAVHVGSLFRITNCVNFSFINFEANGSSNTFKLLKVWGAGANPYEREHDGMCIYNSQNVTALNIQLNNFTRDGMMILQDSGLLPVSKLTFTNCIFNNNGRNGVSWCGGENVNFYNCIFSNNCKGKILTNPGAGLDIEPERGALCKKGSFIKCQFLNNGGYSLVSGYVQASDVVFDSCTIIGNSNYAAMCISPKFVFNNCSFAGSCLLTYDAKNESEGMKFNNCSFTDSLPKQKIFVLNYLTGITGRYAKFTKCSFTSYKVPLLYTEIKKQKSLADNENSLFTSCFFEVYFKKASTWGQNAFLVSSSLFINCTFKSGGYANFKKILNDSEKNIYQQKSVFVNN